MIYRDSNMATGIHVTKLASMILRSRAAVLQNLNEVYKPSALDSWNKLRQAYKAGTEKIAESELARKAKAFRDYYTLEMSPPGINEMQKIKEDLSLTIDFLKSGSFRHLTVRQAWLLFLVALEVSLWFFLGETFGKMNIVGYVV